jgi:hypothetical protein
MRSNRGVVIGVLTAVVLMIVFTTYDVQSLINASEPGLVTLPWAGGSGGGGGSGGSGGPAGGHSTSPSEAGPAGEVAVGANGALLQAFTETVPLVRSPLRWDGAGANCADLGPVCALEEQGREGDAFAAFAQRLRDCGATLTPPTPAAANVGNGTVEAEEGEGEEDAPVEAGEEARIGSEWAEHRKRLSAGLTGRVDIFRTPCGTLFIQKSALHVRSVPSVVHDCAVLRYLNQPALAGGGLLLLLLLFAVWGCLVCACMCRGLVPKHVCA